VLKTSDGAHITSNVSSLSMMLCDVGIGSSVWIAARGMKARAKISAKHVVKTHNRTMLTNNTIVLVKLSFFSSGMFSITGSHIIR